MKKTSLNQIEITDGGTVQFRIALDIMSGPVIDVRKWHRSAVEKGGDVDAQMAAVNTHLESMGWPPITDYKALKDHAALASQDA